MSDSAGLSMLEVKMSKFTTAQLFATKPYLFLLEKVSCLDKELGSKAASEQATRLLERCRVDR